MRKAYRLSISQTHPVRIQWRILGQHGGRWYDVLDWGSGDPIEFLEVSDAQDWIQQTMRKAGVL